MKTCSNRRGCFHKISIGINDKHISSIGGTSSLVNKTESIADIIITFWIGTFPTTLFDFGIEINIWIVRILCLVVAWFVGHYQVFKRWFVFLPAFCIAIVISVATKTLPVSLNIENYILVLVLLVCQMTIKTTIYETVEVEQLKKGMILTTFSSMLMQTSITKGLPGVSTEDLKSRLSSDEIESIKIWAKATHTEKLTIVKKIPFAIFISIGMCLYGAIWGLLLWA